MSGLAPKTVIATGSVMLGLSTATYAARMYFTSIRKRNFAWEDFWLTAAWASYVVLTALYFNTAHPVSRIEALEEGRIVFTPQLLADAKLVQGTYFFTSIILWISLWLVKAAFLSLYRRLVANIYLYVILWWAVVVICFVTLVLAIVSSILSCSSLDAWFTPGQCIQPRDIYVSFISLWYAYAADIFTDLLVMLLPLALIRNLQMHWKRKVSIAGLFCLGLVCLTVSTIRVSYLGHNRETASFNRPAPQWLALWAMVECAIALIIGCCPGLYREVRITLAGRPSYYENNHAGRESYARAWGGQSASGSGARNKRRDDVEMQSYHLATAANDRTGSSQEELVDPLGENKITVTKSVIAENKVGRAY